MVQNCPAPVQADPLTVVSALFVEPVTLLYIATFNSQPALGGGGGGGRVVKRLRRGIAWLLQPGL